MSRTLAALCALMLIALPLLAQDAPPEDASSEAPGAELKQFIDSLNRRMAAFL